MQPSLPSKRVEIVITILGLLGAFLFFALYDQAFPSAALKLDLSRDQIVRRAQETMQAYGYELDDYKLTLTFTRDWSSVIYLQRVLGISEMNRRIQSEALPLWFWRARWFRPMESEEFLLYLSPQGEVVAFFHRMCECEEEEGVQGEQLSEEDAQALAEQYLIETHGWEMGDLELVSSSSEESSSGRMDHSFIWKRSDFSIGESELRISVSLYGDQVNGYDYYLKTPEEFWREFSEQSSRAGFIDGISTTLGVQGFTVIAMLAFGWGLLRHARPRKSSYLIALGAGLISLLSDLNYLPLYPAYYYTAQGYSQFWFEVIFYALLSAVGVSVFVFLLWVGGERLGKLAWPRQNKILSLRGDRWVNLARSSWRGLMLGGISGGYAVLFYLIATRFLGGWAPMDASYTNLYATPFPFLGPILSGLLPAIEEEVLFRLVGIGLILGLTRRRWLALLVPGTLWAFAHLTYVRDPYYLRGIELLFPAVFLYGLFFLRFDLTTTIVAHMAFNATLGALPMLRSGELYFVFSGMVVILFLFAPIAPGLVHAARRKLRGKVLVEPQVGPAGEEDLGGLTALPLEGQGWASLLFDPQKSVFCLRVDDQVVGVAVGRIEEGQGILSQVFVSPEWRGRYWGSELAEAVCADLEAKGAQSIETSALAHNRLALAFLASQGWRSQRIIFERGSLPTLPYLGEKLRAGFSRLFLFALRKPRQSGSGEQDGEAASRPEEHDAASPGDQPLENMKDVGTGASFSN